MLVEGRCGNTMVCHMADLAPCHLPFIDPTINPELAWPPTTLGCEHCHFTDNANVMLCCDGCGDGWHTYCLNPPLAAVPKGRWVCDACKTKGITPEALQHRNDALERVYEKERSAQLFPSKDTRAADTAAEKMNGFRVVRTLRGVQQWGTLHFQGATYRPTYFMVVYDNDNAAPDYITLRKANKWKAPLAFDNPSTSHIPPSKTIVPKPPKKKPGRPRSISPPANTPATGDRGRRK